MASRGKSSTVQRQIMFAVIAVLAFVALAVATTSLSKSQDSGPVSAHSLGTINTPAADPSGGLIPPFNPSSVGTTLSQTSLPYVITVLGDSTGDAQDEWVFLVARKIAADYGRPVTVHDWSNEANDYTGKVTIPGGSGAPVTIWNSSASGKNSGYSLTYLQQAAPEPSNLVILNHGHNDDAPGTLTTNFRSIASRLQAANTNFVVILQNPRADSPRDVARQRANVEELRSQFPTTIDVYSAFSKAPNLTALLNAQNRFHPNSQGEQLWANTVATAFAIR